MAHASDAVHEFEPLTTPVIMVFALLIPRLILGYLILLLSGLTAAAIYTEFRRRRFEPGPSQDRIFRCEKCGYVYTDDPDVDLSRCSQCGKMNNAIQF
ncbi:MAG TPA: hypothetical protein VHH88_09135 [Verrucomicrobiae bacterium]|nr:hypothetical protein [Verrucomicrobiae bacterium]